MQGYNPKELEEFASTGKVVEIDAFGDQVNDPVEQKLIFPVASQLLGPDGGLVCLVKPQFEAGREQVGKKGIVRDKNVHMEVIENVISYAKDNGLFVNGMTYSPITGAKGNIEYLLYLRKEPSPEYPEEQMQDKVRETVELSHKELEE